MSVWQQLLASRKFWIAVTAMVLAVAAALGLDEAKAERVMKAIVALAGVLMGAISYEDGQEKRGTMGELGPPIPMDATNTGRMPVPPVAVLPVAVPPDAGDAPGKAN